MRLGERRKETRKKYFLKYMFLLCVYKCMKREQPFVYGPQNFRGANDEIGGSHRHHVEESILLGCDAVS
jgi:hypothetical protein